MPYGSGKKGDRSRPIWGWILVCFVGLFARVGLAEDPGRIVLVDVDDTLKLAQIGQPGNVLGVVRHGLSTKNLFIGVREALGAAAKRANLYYVSGRSYPISALLKNFVAGNNLPQGKLVTGRRPGAPIMDFKVERIREIMRAHPEEHFVLVGDNGETDPDAYYRLQQDPELGRRIDGVFIRRLYDRPAGSIPAGTQREFLTSGELALGLFELGLVSASDAADVITKVADGLESELSHQRHSALPHFAEVGGLDVGALLARYPGRLDPALAGPVARLERLLKARALPVVTVSPLRQLFRCFAALVSAR